jgi:hypothetical protein
MAIECDDDIISDRQFQVGFKLSAEDLPSALVGDNLVRDFLPFVQVTHARPLDCVNVTENVRAARVRLNEPRALRCIEPFHAPVAIANSS